MFYIYFLINPITQQPFYVGVGKKNRRSNVPREQSHIKEALQYSKGTYHKQANRHKLNTILQIINSGLEVIIKISDITYELEVDAFNEEIRLISLYGRRDLGTGILTNMTDGGEGRINPSPESRAAASALRKGQTSPLKGVILGPYSESRRIAQKEKMKKTRQLLTEDQKAIHHENRSKAQLGKEPWNKGLSKDNNHIIAKYALEKTGKPRLDMIGKEPWNKGKKCPEMGKSKIGKPAHNKGKPSGKKGMSYEEIYGKEKAEEMKEQRRLRKIKYWEDHKNKAA
jgi:hypothetical protein